MKRTNSALLAIMLTALLFLLTLMSERAKAGATEGMKLAGGVIIPALLPVLVITNTIMKSRAGRVFELLLGGLTEKVLRLPKSAAVPIFFGLIGGYPAGALLTLEAFRSGDIGKDDARRIMRFNMCGGVAFIVSAVGGYYGNTKTGFALYIINILSSFIIAAAQFFTKRDIQRAPHTSRSLPFSQALCGAAESSSRSVILMSVYIILFAAVMKIIPLNERLYPLLEITNGIFRENKIALPYCAFFLSFGGLCIHLQLVGALSEMKIKYIDFLIFRVLSGVISFALGYAYCALFPEAAEVFSNVSGETAYQFTSANNAYAILMMLSCAALVLDIEGKKIKL